MEKLNWIQKRDMIVNTSLVSSKQIMRLFDVGQPIASDIKNKTIELAKQKGRWFGMKKVPTDLVLEVMGVDFEFFNNMANNEKRLINDSAGV